MTPTFTKALRYRVTVTCLSPLRTGGSEQSREPVLQYRSGICFLQGNSLAGAMRGWRDDEVLFGRRNAPGTLTVSDLVFDAPDLITRPHAHMDSTTGALLKNTIFSALPTGTKGSFCLVWQGSDGIEQAQQAIEEYLAALDCGEILLGAHTANGFGRIRLQAARRCYDLYQKEDRQAWFSWQEDTDDGEPVILPHLPRGSILFRVRAEVPSILVKASLSQGNRQNKYLSAVPIEENGRSVIPGSSLKGAVRAQMERIAPSFGIEDETAQMLGYSCSRENPGAAGKLFFSEGHFAGEEQPQTHMRLRINQFTGGIFSGISVFDKTTGGTLCWEIRAPKDAPRICGLLLFALRDLGLGMYQIGSGSAIGRGYAESLEVEMEAPEGLAKLCCRDGSVTLEDPSGFAGKWIQALGGEPA